MTNGWNFLLTCVRVNRLGNSPTGFTLKFWKLAHEKTADTCTAMYILYLRKLDCANLLPRILISKPVSMAWTTDSPRHTSKTYSPQSPCFHQSSDCLPSMHSYKQISPESSLAAILKSTSLIISFLVLFLSLKPITLSFKYSIFYVCFILVISSV